MNVKKSLLILIGLFCTLAVLPKCNSSAGQEMPNTRRITTIELRSYLARLRFPEDSTSPPTPVKTNDAGRVSSHDGDVRAELTERSD